MIFLIVSLIHIFLFSVSVDRERFDPCSFCVADIDGSRVAFFVLPSREVYFLCILPRSLLHKSPWEVSFRPVSLEKKLYQIHLEFVDTCMLPCWYETKRVTHVEKVTVLPIQGECFSEKNIQVPCGRRVRWNLYKILYTLI